jgi:hypothetical protein
MDWAPSWIIKPRRPQTPWLTTRDRKDSRRHISARGDTFRLPVPALRVESAVMSVSAAKRLISYMPFCAWCIGVAFLRGHANRAVRDGKF